MNLTRSHTIGSTVTPFCFPVLLARWAASGLISVHLHHTAQQDQCICTTQHKKISARAPRSTAISVHLYHTAQQDQCTYTTQPSKISAPVPHSTARSVHLHHTAQQDQCTCTTQHSKISAPAPHSTAKSAHLYHTALQESVGVHRSIPDIRILNTQQLEYFDIHIFTLSNYLISYNYLKNLIIRTDRTCYGLKQYLEWEMYSHFLKNLPPLILFTCLVFNA